jgi:3-hydroxyacyl-CoA dehydrogenase
VKAGKKTQEEAKKSFDTVMGRIKTSTNIADAKDCDLIIEVLLFCLSAIHLLQRLRHYASS